MKPSPFLNACSVGLLFIALLGFAFYDVVFLNKTIKVTTANSQALPGGPYGQEHNKTRFIPMNGTDVPVSEEPIFEFIKSNFQQGIFPLWNPHQACGFPLIGMLEIGILFPLNLILYLFSNIYAWDILYLTRLLFSGWLLYFFMRHLRFNNTSAICAGMIFMLSGPMVLLQYWTANVDLLTPLLLLTLDRLIQFPSRRSIAFAGLTVGLTIFAGHPEHVFLVNAYGLAFFIFRVLTVGQKQSKIKLLYNYVLVYLLGAGLASLVLFPFLRNLSHEFWHGHPEGTGLLMEEQRNRALSIALPHFFQLENLKYDFTFAGWWGGYLGTLPVLLAGLGCFKRQLNKLPLFFGIMAVIIIGKEYGVPVINFLGALPIFNVCRFAIHTPALAAMTIAILAGIGVQFLLEDRRAFSKFLILSLVLMLIVTLHLMILNREPFFGLALKATGYAALLIGLFLLIVWLKDHRLLSKRILRTVIILTLFTELFSYIHRERPFRFDSFGKVPYIEFLKSQNEPQRSYGIFWAFYPNTATGFGVDDLGYFLGLVPERFVQFVNTLLIPDHFKPDLRPPALRAIPIDSQKRSLLDLLNVRYIVTPSDGKLKSMINTLHPLHPYAQPVYKNEVTIYERPTALPRAFIVHRVFFEEQEEKSLQLLRNLGDRVREGVILNSPPNPKLIKVINTLPMQDQSRVVIEHRSANEIILKAQMQSPGFVVLSEAYHPDWKAQLDGQDWKIYQANYLLRAVFVPPGEHKIKMTFAPWSFYAGVGVSAMSLIILLFLLGSSLKYKKP